MEHFDSLSTQLPSAPCSAGRNSRLSVLHCLAYEGCLINGLMQVMASLVSNLRTDPTLIVNEVNKLDSPHA